MDLKELINTGLRGEGNGTSLLYCQIAKKFKSQSASWRIKLKSKAKNF